MEMEGRVGRGREGKKEKEKIKFLNSQVMQIVEEHTMLGETCL